MPDYDRSYPESGHDRQCANRRARLIRDVRYWELANADLTLSVSPCPV
jgi:hypothetical protein